MSEHHPQAGATDGLDEVHDHDEIDDVLSTLRALLGRVASPVVRACLEEARDDIAHLVGRDDPPHADDGLVA